MAKSAPVLTAFLSVCGKRPAATAEAEQAHSELRALVACARELRSIQRARGHDPKGCDCTMCRCLRRLDGGEG